LPVLYLYSTCEGLPSYVAAEYFNRDRQDGQDKKNRFTMKGMKKLKFKTIPFFRRRPSLPSCSSW